MKSESHWAFGRLSRRSSMHRRKFFDIAHCESRCDGKSGKAWLKAKVGAGNRELNQIKPNAFREFMSLPHRCPTPQGRKGHEKKCSKVSVAAVLCGFEGLFQERFGAILPCLPKRRGRPPGAIGQSPFRFGFSCYEQRCTLAEHFGQLFEDELCDSSLSERRSRLPWEVFSELMRLGLRTLAQPDIGKPSGEGGGCWRWMARSSA